MPADRKPVLLIIASILMLLTAIPMTLWCLSLINSAALDYTYAGAGCFVAAFLYNYSMVVAIAGLVFARRPYYHRWCRWLAFIQLAVGVLLIVPLSGYAALTLPPLFLFTIIYLIDVRTRPD